MDHFELHTLSNDHVDRQNFYKRFFNTCCSIEKVCAAELFFLYKNLCGRSYA